jgi:alpha-amylase/alpha-mannosidase (GH57 family)
LAGIRAIAVAVAILFAGLAAMPTSGGAPDSPALPEPRQTGVLNLAIIWHMHQPLYRNQLTGEYDMPWVRDHGPSQYLDHPKILAQYPGVNLTFNLVPSLIRQIEDYAFSDASDNHINLARIDLATATPEQRRQIASEFTRLAPWHYTNVSGGRVMNPWYDIYPVWPRLNYLVNRVGAVGADGMTDQELQDLETIFFLHQISMPYVEGDYDLAERNDTILQLLSKPDGTGFTQTDTETVLAIQREIMKQIVPAYAAVRTAGQAEIITTPYYHPISPLLMMDGIPADDGTHTIPKAAWENDTREQYRRGYEDYVNHFGAPPAGVWNSENAVSEAIIPPMVDAGFQWTVSDQGVLYKSNVSTGLVGRSVDNQTAVYTVTVDGRTASVLFRDQDLSNKVSFGWGGRTTQEAVDEFESILASRVENLSDPDNALLTIAADGENWMFLAGYPNDGRDFLHALYQRLLDLQAAGWVRTWTVEDFLARPGLVSQPLAFLATGSWDGTNSLQTWQGEEEEQVGWARLVRARQAVVDFTIAQEGRDFVDPVASSPEVKAAWEAVFAAEGSDWFWWYGRDQDSGADGQFDILFKEHLRAAYLLAGATPPVDVTTRWGPEATPDSPPAGPKEIVLDGAAGTAEWANASHYTRAVSGGERLLIKDLYVGFDYSTLYVRVDINGDPDPSQWALGEDLDLYVSQPIFTALNDMETNLNRYALNFATATGDHSFEWGAGYRFRILFDQALSSGFTNWALFKPQTSSDFLGTGSYVFQYRKTDQAAVVSTIEVAIPLADLGAASGDLLRIVAVTSRSGADVDILPSDPAQVRIPIAPAGPPIASFQDPIGDDVGDGDYTYPLASDFKYLNGQHASDKLWDLTWFNISENPVAVQFTIGFADIGTNQWNAPFGFSFQIVNIYIDTDRIPGSGNTAMISGPNAEVLSNFSWETMASVGGWGQTLFVTDSSGVGSFQQSGVTAVADPARHSVVVTIPKRFINAANPDPRTWSYVVVSGSQDGFGVGFFWRAVAITAETWKGGGGALSGKNPNIYDAILPDWAPQTAVLGGYTDTQLTRVPGVVIQEAPPIVPQNHRPTLRDPRLTPDSGDTSTVFRFSVTYADEDGDDPEQIAVVIDGTSHEMAYIGGLNATGATYRLEMTLAAGAHAYYFFADDGNGTANTTAQTTETTLMVASAGADLSSFALIGAGAAGIVAAVVVALLFMRRRRRTI